MDREDIQQRISKFRKSKDLEDTQEIPLDEKIPVEIRDIVRIRPQDFSALKNSFEEWRKSWE
jgi:hypothetical protein